MKLKQNPFAKKLNGENVLKCPRKRATVAALCFTHGHYPVQSIPWRRSGGLFAGLQDLVDLKTADLCHPRKGATEIISFMAQ